MRELRKLGPENTPVVLCGLKKDLRDKSFCNYADKNVSSEEGELASKKMGCVGYAECSATG
jgi:hypothetical protein